MSLTVETAGPNLVDGIVRTPSSWNDRETSQLWFLYFQIETESLTQFWSIKSLKSFFLKKNQYEFMDSNVYHASPSIEITHFYAQIVPSLTGRS